MFLLNDLEKHGIDCHGQSESGGECFVKPQTTNVCFVQFMERYIGVCIGNKFIIITIILYLFTL